MGFLKSCLFFLVSFIFCQQLFAEENSDFKKHLTTQIEVSNSKKDKNQTQQEKNIQKDTIKKEKIHIVQNGDNIYRIALKYKISQSDLLKANNLSQPNIFVGQKLILPENAFLEGKTNENQQQSNNDKKIEEVENKNLNKVETVQEKQIKLVNKLDSTTFVWPARGSIIGKFGSPTKTGKSEGIYIGCENGTVVRATSSGIVSYSDKVVGYGHVILITHYNGFITAYGYVDPLVMVGDKIKKGQVIAYIKKVPNSKRSQLYFSIRKDGKSYDPEKIIQTKISN